MGLIKRKILQLMTTSGNSFGRVILFNAFGDHGYGNRIISFLVAISYLHAFWSEQTILRAELILIQTMKIEYYNKVSVSFIFLLNEKKKRKKKKKEEEITTMMRRLFWTKTK